MIKIYTISARVEISKSDFNKNRNDNDAIRPGNGSEHAGGHEIIADWLPPYTKDYIKN